MLATTLLSTAALLLSGASAAPLEKKTYTPVSFTNTFPSVLHPNQDVYLSWEGGEGLYDVYAILSYPGIVDPSPDPFVRNSSQTSYVFNTGAAVYGPNTTITFGVDDSDQGAPNNQGWYYLSQPIPAEN